MREEKIVGKFLCNKENWIVVRLNGAAICMPTIEWNRCYGRRHPELWERKREKK